MVVTRSKSGTTKKADTKIAVNHKVAVRASKKTTAERASKQTRKKETALMDSALSIFMIETFKKQYREKHPDIKITSKVINAGEKEWISMTASDKAPSVAEAEKRLAEHLIYMEAYKQGCTMKVTRAKSGMTKKVDSKNAVKRKVAERASKQTRMKEREVMDSAFSVFMEETFKKQYREKYPGIKISKVINAGEEEWNSMTVSDKAPYVSEVEKRLAEHLINVEAYKVCLLNDDENDEESGEEGDDE